MKHHKAKTSIIIAVLGVALLGGLMQATAQVLWTGLGSSQLWSDTNNWSTLMAPGLTDQVRFTNSPSSASSPGVVNNEVASDRTIRYVVDYAHISPGGSPYNNYYTTLIDPGTTLTVSNGSLTVGDLAQTTNDDSYYYSVTGAGTLVNGTSTNVIHGLQVSSIVTTTATNHMATLDLSGLDNFSMSGWYFWVGINGGGSSRPAGTVLLAKTNTITINGGAMYDAGANYSTYGGSFRVGESKSITPTKPSTLELGQQNVFNLTMMKIGGQRAGSLNGNPPAGAYMYFEPGLVNPTFKLRGLDGVSRMPDFRIADNDLDNGASIQSQGTVDFSGGTVDILANSLLIAKGAGGGTTSDNTYGTLTFTAGTIDATTLIVGYMYGNIAGNTYGTLNVVSPAAKVIANDVYFGFDAGNAAGTGIAVINLDGGTMIVSNSLSEYLVNSTRNPSSTLNLTNNGTLQFANPITATFDTLNYSSGTISNGTLNVGTINVDSPATTFTLAPGLALDPAGGGTVGTLNVNGGLTMSGGTLDVDLSSGSSDQYSVSGALDLSNPSYVSVSLVGPVVAGTYPFMTYGSLSGSPANLQLELAGAYGPVLSDSRVSLGLDTTAPNVSVTVSGSPANLTWSGGNNGNTWDVKNTANFDSGADQFYQIDNVTFDDSGNASSPVQLSGALYPGSITFAASSKHYTLAGSGNIVGAASVTLTGGAKVTLLATNNNYTGGTTISGGILEIGDGTTADGALSGNVTNNSELDFNPASSNNITAVIAGTGTIVKNGPGVTRLAGASGAFTGSVTVNQGTLLAGSATAVGSGYGASGEFVTVNSGATFDIGGNIITNSFELEGGTGVGGNGALINSGPTANFVRDVDLAGDTTFGGAAGWTVQQSSASGTEPGLYANGHKITKVGPNQIFVNGLNSGAFWNQINLASVDIKEGMFTLGGYLTLGTDDSDPITVFTNATLGLRTSSTHPITKSLVFNDGSCVHVPTLAGGLQPTIDGSVTLGGSVVFDVDTSQTLIFDTPITGGTLVKGIGYHPSASPSTGTGTLILAGANTVSGFRVETGTVVLTNGTTVSAPQLQLAGGTLFVDTLTLASGQSLVGNGTVLGMVSSPSGTSVTPSATNGIITVSSNLTLRGTTTLDLNRTSGVVTNSQIIVGTNATLDCGGSLVLTSSGGALQAGDTFKLFTAGMIVNPFTDASITYPALSDGLYWTNRIAIDGTVAVASTEPTNPPALAATLSGGSSLSVSWPAGYTSYVLQIQTNSLSVGLNTNWTTISTTNNQIVLPIDPANGAVFLRLLKQ